MISTNLAPVILQTSVTLHFGAHCPYNNKLDFLQNTYLLQSTYRIHLSYRLQSLYILVPTVLLTIRSISDMISTNLAPVILQTSVTLHFGAHCPYNNKLDFLQNTYLLQSTYRIHLSYRLQSLYILVPTVLLTIRSISDMKSTNFAPVILQTSVTLHFSANCTFNNKIYL